MFSFKHPKPVDSRRPVATLVQQHQERVLELPVEEATPDALALGTPFAAVAPLDAVPFVLHFLVRYTLGEYIGFMWQHAGWLIRRRRVGRFNSRYLRIKSTFMAALHFILLRRGSRTYEMTIDAHGIVRVSDSGVTLIGWDDVRLIRRYRNGFLMVLQRGTLPIPYRCLQQEEITALRGFATTLKTLAA
jgi:hypothetical protein